MSTLVSSFREPLRHLLGDRDATVYQYADTALDAGIRAMVRMGKVEGRTLAPDNLSVTPAVEDPNDYALLLYETVRSFIASNPDGYAYKTRAMGERFGGWRVFLESIEDNLAELKAGNMFDGWQSFSGWFTSLTGSGDLWADMTRMNVTAPVQSVNVGVDGVSVEG